MHMALCVWEDTRFYCVYFVCVRAFAEGRGRRARGVSQFSAERDLHTLARRGDDVRTAGVLAVRTLSMWSF